MVCQMVTKDGGTTPHTMLLKKHADGSLKK